MLKQWLSFLSFLLIALACTSQPDLIPVTPVASPVPTLIASTAIPTIVPQPTPTIEPTASTSPSSAVSRELSDSLAACIWNVAHTDELPTLPADWLASPNMMEQLKAAGVATPEDLHTTAKFDVLGYDSLKAYRTDAYTVAQENDDALYTLSLHYLYCNELWQGYEATEVTAQDDAYSAVAECAWRIAHSDGLPEVPKGIENLTPSQLKTEAQSVTKLAVSASAVDTILRARVDAGLDEWIVTGSWHRVFCGGDWAGAQ